MKRHWGLEFIYLYVFFLVTWATSNIISAIYVQQNVFKWISLTLSISLVVLGFIMIRSRRMKDKRKSKDERNGHSE